MILLIVLICIVLSFCIVVTISYDKNKKANVLEGQKLTDDVEILFSSNDENGQGNL